jgi:hydroxymethylglutaryl-CoA lyase
VEAAWNAGIRYFESAMGGYGGCPMTGYELLGNLNTLYLIDWCELNNIETGLDSMQIEQARSHADIIFRSKY